MKARVWRRCRMWAKDLMTPLGVVAPGAELRHYQHQGLHSLSKWYIRVTELGLDKWTPNPAPAWGRANSIACILRRIKARMSSFFFSQGIRCFKKKITQQRKRNGPNTRPQGIWVFRIPWFLGMVQSPLLPLPLSGWELGQFDEAEALGLMGHAILMVFTSRSLSYFIFFHIIPLFPGMSSFSFHLY